MRLIHKQGNMVPGNRLASTATKRACERNGWTTKQRSPGFNVIVTVLTPSGLALCEQWAAARVKLVLPQTQELDHAQEPADLA